MANSRGAILRPLSSPVDRGYDAPGEFPGRAGTLADFVPEFPALPTDGIEVREQCSRCKCEVRETLSGVCFDCLVL